MDGRDGSLHVSNGPDCGPIDCRCGQKPSWLVNNPDTELFCIVIANTEYKALLVVDVLPGHHAQATEGLEDSVFNDVHATPGHYERQVDPVCSWSRHFHERILSTSLM